MSRQLSLLVLLLSMATSSSGQIIPSVPNDRGFPYDKDVLNKTPFGYDSSRYIERSPSPSSESSHATPSNGAKHSSVRSTYDRPALTSQRANDEPSIEVVLSNLVIFGSSLALSIGLVVMGSQYHRRRVICSKSPPLLTDIVAGVIMLIGVSALFGLCALPELFEGVPGVATRGWSGTCFLLAALFGSVATVGYQPPQLHRGK